MLAEEQEMVCSCGSHRMVQLPKGSYGKKMSLVTTFSQTGQNLWKDIWEGWQFSLRMWGINDLPGPHSDLARPSGTSTPWGSTGCAHSLLSSLTHEQVVPIIVWVLPVNAVEAGVHCATPRFPQPHTFSVGVGRQGSSMGLQPWGGKGGYPHAMQEIWDLPELKWISESETGTWQVLLLLFFLLPLSLLTLWLDRQSLFILTCEPFFSKSLPETLTF